MGGGADKVIVAVKAEKVISKTALAWALTHVGHPGDCVTLLAVFSAVKTGEGSSSSYDTLNSLFLVYEQNPLYEGPQRRDYRLNDLEDPYQELETIEERLVLRVLEGGDPVVPLGLDLNTAGSRSGHLHGLSSPRPEARGSHCRTLSHRKWIVFWVMVFFLYKRYCGREIEIRASSAVLKLFKS